MIQMLGAVAPLAKILFSTIEKSVPDKDLQAKLKSDLQTQLLQSNTQELTAAAKIIEAEAKGIRGKETTPFLLARVKELTGGDSLESNIALVYNNAKIAAQLSVELVKLYK